LLETFGNLANHKVESAGYYRKKEEDCDQKELYVGFFVVIKYEFHYWNLFILSLRHELCKLFLAAIKALSLALNVNARVQTQNIDLS